MDEERRLHSVPLVDENQIVVRPQRQEDPSQIADGEIVFRTVLVDDDPFEGQGSSYPLECVSL